MPKSLTDAIAERIRAAAAHLPPLPDSAAATLRGVFTRPAGELAA